MALIFPGDPDSADDDSSSESFPTVWVEPIGTASDGSETTFIFNEIDSGDVALFGDEPTGTVAVTTCECRSNSSATVHFDSDYHCM